MEKSLRVTLAIGLTFVGLHLAGGALAEDSQPLWSVGLGGSIASDYTYRTLHFSFGDFDESFGKTWMASLSVNRRLETQTSLQTGLDYFQQEDHGEAISVRIACLGAGVRCLFDRDERAHPYLELLPALYMGRWTDDLRDYSITSLRPGLVAGFGFTGPLAGRFQLDVGMKAHLSTGWPQVGYVLSEADYRGVKRLTLGAKILYGI